MVTQDNPTTIPTKHRGGIFLLKNCNFVEYNDINIFCKKQITSVEKVSLVKTQFLISATTSAKLKPCFILTWIKEQEHTLPGLQIKLNPIVF